MIGLGTLLRVKHYRWPLYIALVLAGTTTWGEIDIANNNAVNVEMAGNGKAAITRNQADTLNAIFIQGSTIVTTIITILFIDS